MKSTLSTWMTLGFTALLVAALVWIKLGNLMGDVVDSVAKVGGG